MRPRREDSNERMCFQRRGECGQLEFYPARSSASVRALHLMAIHTSHRELLSAWPSLELVILSQCLLLQAGRKGLYANMFRLGVDERVATHTFQEGPFK